MTSLFKASQLLEFTFDAYQYARGAARDQFDLSRRSEQHIKQFEEMFKSVRRLFCLFVCLCGPSAMSSHTHTHTQMIHFRVNTDLSKAATELEECQKSLGNTNTQTQTQIINPAP